MSADDDGEGETAYGYYEYAVIFNPDGSCSDEGIIEITDPRESYETIKALKQTNNWNMPLVNGEEG